VTFGNVWYEPGGQLGPRIQGDYQLVVVHLGQADVVIDKQRSEISPGSVALLLPGRQEAFRFAVHHPTHHTWCAVRPDTISTSLRRRLADSPTVQTQSQTFDFLMKAAFGIASWRKEEGRHMLRLLGSALLEEYVRMAREGLDEANRESPQERGRRYLEDHGAEENCLNGAAQAAGVTPQHLIRLFRQHYQITPGRFLWQTRVERGAALLAATGLTVSEIADRCGFKNPFHFSRLMRKMQGLSPRQLRQRAWVKAQPAPLQSSRKIKPPGRSPKSAGNGADRTRVLGAARQFPAGRQPRASRADRPR
jgi:AraC-like DNA-binding protein